MDALTTEKLCPGLIALGRETKPPKVVWVKALAGPATGDVADPATVCPDALLDVLMIAVAAPPGSDCCCIGSGYARANCHSLLDSGATIPARRCRSRYGSVRALAR